MKERFSQAYYSTRNYKGYLDRKFDRLADELIRVTGIKTGETVIDFGCGYGGLVNAFWQRGFQRIWGTDISQWAIEYGHAVFPHLQERLQFYNRDLLRKPNRLLILLDVLEHMPGYEIESVLKLASKGSRGVVVVRIPVCQREGEPFVLPVSNNDPTHISCHTKGWWRKALRGHGFDQAAELHEMAIYDSPGVMASLWRKFA